MPSFLDADPESVDVVVAPEPVIEPVVAEPEAQPEQPGQPRDEHGRFAPVEPPEQRDPQVPPAGYVPTTALQAERERRQTLEAQLAAYQAPPEADVWTDPEAFAEHQRQLIANATLKVKLDLSEDMARSKYGEDAVTAAQEWAQQRFAQSPAYQQEVLSQRNPYEFVLQAHQREQALASMTADDLAKFRQWQQSQATPQNPHAASPPPPPTPVAPPPQSITAAPSAAGAAHVPTGPGNAYDGLFRKQ